MRVRTRIMGASPHSPPDPRRLDTIVRIIPCCKGTLVTCVTLRASRQSNCSSESLIAIIVEQVDPVQMRETLWDRALLESSWNQVDRALWPFVGGVERKPDLLLYKACLAHRTFG